jgi:hypothetical protein
VAVNSGQVLLWSTQSYRDFEMRFQARIKGKGLCAVQFRGEFNNDDKGHVWLRGPQLNIGVVAEGSLYERDKMLQLADPIAVKKVLRDNDFNTYSIRCQHKHITLKVNGLTTVVGRYDQIPVMGNFCFYIQAGFSPKEITFRNIEIKGGLP